MRHDHAPPFAARSNGLGHTDTRRGVGDGILAKLIFYPQQKRNLSE